MNFFQANSGLFWTAGSIGGALAVFFVLSRLFGWKIAAVVAGAMVAFGQLKAALARSKKEGWEQRDEYQREANQNEIDAANAAAAAERERQRREGSGSLRPNDPYVVDRHSARGMRDDGNAGT